MQWFDDVQIFLVSIISIILINFVLFLLISRKRGKKSIEIVDEETTSVKWDSSNEFFGFAECDGNGVNGRKKRSRALFVLNNFSDLVLYFGPILFATLRKCEIFILNIQPCYGRRYLWQKKCADVVCETVGLSASNIVFIWDQRFPDQRTNSADDPWPILSLMQIIQSYAVVFDVDFITTYDADGICDHPGRQAINEAVGALWRKRMLAKHVEIYLLTSSSVVRSISGIFDAPISWLSCRSVAGPYRRGRLMSSLSEFLILQRLYVLCEWRSGAVPLWTRIKVGTLLILNRYFLTNDYHTIQDEEKYRLHD